MKKLLLFFVSAFLLISLSAQVPDLFSGNTAGGKLTKKAQTMGTAKASDVVLDVIFETNFDDVPDGSYVAQSYPEFWETWDNHPGTSEDALITSEQASSTPNSAKLKWGSDLVFLAGDKTWGVYTIDFDMYIPLGGRAYFNLLQIFDRGNEGQDSEWAASIFFNVSGDGGPEVGTYVYHNEAATYFTFPNNTWFHVSVYIDLNDDLASVTIDGTQILEWEYHITEYGDIGTRQLGAVDFYPPQSGNASTFFIDNFKFAGDETETFPIIDVTPTEITQDIPAGGTISVPITVSNTGTCIGDYSSWIEFEIDEPPVGTNQFDLAYCTEEPSFGYGFASAGFSELGVKLTGDVLCDKVGSYITKVAYFLTDHVDGDAITFRIYGSRGFNITGEVLAEVTLMNPIVDDWNEIELPEPLLITKTELWLSVGYDQLSGTFPIGNDAGKQIPGVNWLKRNSESSNWFKYWDEEEEDANIMLRAYAEGGVIPACWLSTSGDSYGAIRKGTTKTFNAVFNAAGLELGETYTSSIYVATEDAENPLYIIPCSLTVGAFPLIKVNPTSIEEKFPIDAEEKTATVTLTVANEGSGEGSYEATVGSVAWLTLDGATEGTVTAGESKTFDAVIDATGLEVGEYEDKISVTTNDFTNPLIEIPCKLVIKVGIEVYINGVETKVYPNPATDVITVESNITMSSVQIINHAGQVVYSSVVNGELTTVNTSNLSAGYYFVKINTDKGSRSIKFVVK